MEAPSTLCMNIFNVCETLIQSKLLFYKRFLCLFIGSGTIFMYGHNRGSTGFNCYWAQEPGLGSVLCDCSLFNKIVNSILYYFKVKAY